MGNEHSNIILCLYQRRFDEFNLLPDFHERVIRQNNWVSHLIDKGIQVFFIFGARNNAVIDSSIGTIYLIRDKERSSRLSHSVKFYRNAAKLIKNKGTTHVICQGLNDCVSHTFLKSLLKKKTTLIYQDHASYYRNIQVLFRPFFLAADYITFNSKGQEIEWVNNGIFPKEKIRYLPEGTSNFVLDHKERLIALEQSKKVKILWLGNLNKRKDPITVLRALSKTTSNTLELTMIYKENTLEKEVAQEIESNAMHNKVTLVGSVNHNELKDYFKSHHFIISASEREGSGYAVIEALSCGLVAILTKIPSFVDFTNLGSVGLHFDRGDVNGLARILDKLSLANYSELSIASLTHYQNRFSPEATANRLLNILEENYW